MFVAYAATNHHDQAEPSNNNGKGQHTLKIQGVSSAIRKLPFGFAHASELQWLRATKPPRNTTAMKRRKASDRLFANTCATKQQSIPPWLKAAKQGRRAMKQTRTTSPPLSCQGKYRIARSNDVCCKCCNQSPRPSRTVKQQWKRTATP